MGISLSEPIVAQTNHGDDSSISSVKYSKANWYKQKLKIVVKQDSLLSLEELDKREKKASFTLEKEMK